MKKLNIVMGLLLVLLCITLVSAVGMDQPEQRFEYAMMFDQPSSITWQTEHFSIVSPSMQDFLIKMSGESVPIGDITQVKNKAGMLNFLGNSGWELVSSYFSRVGLLGVDTTVYIFKREM